MLLLCVEHGLRVTSEVGGRERAGEEGMEREREGEGVYVWLGNDLLLQQALRGRRWLPHLMLFGRIWNDWGWEKEKKKKKKTFFFFVRLTQSIVFPYFSARYLNLFSGRIRLSKWAAVQPDNAVLTRITLKTVFSALSHGTCNGCKSVYVSYYNIISRKNAMHAYTQMCGLVRHKNELSRKKKERAN